MLGAGGGWFATSNSHITIRPWVDAYHFLSTCFIATCQLFSQTYDSPAIGYQRYDQSSILCFPTGGRLDAFVLISINVLSWAEVEDGRRNRSLKALPSCWLNAEACALKR